MLADRRGADLVEWIVVIVIAVGVIGVAVFAVFDAIGGKFGLLDNLVRNSMSP